MALFKSNTPSLIHSLVESVSRQSDLSTALNEIEQSKEGLNKKSRWEDSETGALYQLAEKLLKLSEKSRLNTEDAFRLARIIIFCAIHTMDDDRSKTVALIDQTTDLWIRKKFSSEKLLDFTYKALAAKYPQISILIISKLHPGGIKSVKYLKHLGQNAANISFILDHCLINFERVVILSFSKPDYTENRELIDWIRTNLKDSEIGLACELINNLWLGKLALNKIDVIEATYYSEFENSTTLFGKKVLFTIACIIQKIDSLKRLLAEEEFEVPEWAHQYAGLIANFIHSLSGNPKINEFGTIIQPDQTEFPPPLYYFVLISYSVHALRNNPELNVEKYYSEISGPWEIWVKQFDSEEVPYRPDPDYVKYEQLLYSDLTKPEIKSFIAGWLIEYLFWNKGEKQVLHKIKELPDSLKPVANSRYLALTGKLSDPGDMNARDLNDTILHIRYAVFTKDADKLQSIVLKRNELKVHEAELDYCELALKYISNQEFSGEDLPRIKRTGKRGIPYLYWMVATQFFQNNNYKNAAEYFEYAFNLAPSQHQWNEYCAQCYALCGSYDKSVALLRPQEKKLTENARNLYGWSLFLETFPTPNYLIKMALDHSMDNGMIEKIKLAKEFLSPDTPLRNFIRVILDADNEKLLFEDSVEYPDFADSWLLIKRALLCKDPGDLIQLLDRIEKQDLKSTPDIIHNIVLNQLNNFNFEDKASFKILIQLLERIGVNKEDYFYEQLLADMKKAMPVEELYQKYNKIYDGTHPLFNKVVLFRCFKSNDVKQSLKILNNATDSNGTAYILIRISILIEMEKWKEVLSVIASEYQKIKDKKLQKTLILLGIEICILKETSQLIEFLRIGKNIQIDLNSLPEPVKKKLFGSSINDILNNLNPELTEILKPVLPEAYRSFISILTSDYSNLFDMLGGIKAGGEWGIFIYRQLIKQILDKVKKQDGEGGLSDLLSALPKLIRFIEDNKIAIEEKELMALRNIEVAYEDRDKVLKSLGGILLIEQVEDLIFFSSGFLRSLKYPGDIKKLSSVVYKYIDLKGDTNLDRLWEATAVISAWIDYLLQLEKKRIDDVIEPLMLLLSLLRINLFAHPNFETWFVEQRRKLPEDQQYIKQAGEFLKLPFYNWLLDIYYKELDHWIINNKPEIARMYGRIIESFASSPEKYLEIPNPSGSFFNILKDLFKEKMEDWIKQKKAGLEGAMKADQNERKFYDHNYSPGLTIIDQLLAIFPERKDLLSLGLFYANKWNINHETKAETKNVNLTPSSELGKQILQVIKTYSNRYADGLIPKCKAGKSKDHLAENKAIADHFYYKAKLENQSKPFTYIKQLMKWNSRHDKIFWFYRDIAIKEYNKNNYSTSARNMVRELHDFAPDKSKIKSQLQEDLNLMG